MRNQSRRAFRDDYASNTAPALGFDTGGLNFSATVACVPTHPEHIICAIAKPAHSQNRHDRCAGYNFRPLFQRNPTLPVISFIVVATLMLLAALAFVLVPLLRRGTRAVNQGDRGVLDSASNIAVFRSAKREIEDEFSRGVIQAGERDLALSELSQRLVDEVPEEAASSVIATAAPRASWWLVGALGALIPVAALSIYATLGTPQALNGVATAAAPEPAAKSPMSDKQIVAMVDTLAEKMKQNPGDPKGWMLLARSQGALGRFPEALAAYERATILLPNDAQLLADYADVAVMAQEGRFDGKPATLIQRALKLDPANMKALALAATADMRAGKRDAALVNWKKLKSLVAKDSDDSRQIDAIIAEVEGGRPNDANVLPASAAPPAAVSPPPSSPPPAAKNVNAGTAKVTGKIMLAAEMAAKIAPGDTLFVFARAKQGSRMPLAILKIPAPAADKFPYAFELTDAMAMAPGMNLSSVAEVVIEARISKSGNAKLQAGDVSGVSAPVVPGAANVNVTLSTVAP